MKNKISSYIKKIHGSNKVRRGIVLTLALALLVYNCGANVLRPSGETAPDGPICGLEEHTHTEECYGDVLICDHEEDSEGNAPIHDAAACYESQLICTVTEHVHMEECYAEAEGEADNSDVDTDSLDQGTADEGNSFENGSNDAGTTGNVSSGDSSYDDLDSSGSDSSEVEDSPGSDSFIDGSVSDPDEERDETQTVLMADGLDIMLFNNTETETLQIGITSAVNASAAYVNTADGLVDMHTATKMLSGDWENNNSQDNPYNLYVGETLLIDATQESNGQILEIKKYGDSDYTETVGSGWQSDGLIATYQGTTPGKYRVVLKSDSDAVLSAFYFDVKYPIFVKTKLGDVHKDRVHEYLKIVHEGYYNDKPWLFILDGNGNPLYVKNAGDDPGKYIMYAGHSVVLSAYVSATDNNKTFSTSDADVTVTNYAAEALFNGFYRVTAEVKLEDDCSGNKTIKFGDDEEFHVWVRATQNSGDDANHFDIEIVDGGTYTDVSTALLRDGSIQTTTTIYSAYVSGVNECRVYDENDKIIRGTDDDGNEDVEVGLLTSDQYGRHGKPGEAQYELTSAYHTEEDPNEKGIYRSIEGWLKGRDIRFVDVKKVVFDVDIVLIPKTQTIVITDANGNKQNYTDDNFGDDPDDEERTVNLEYTMDETAILDAFNKCPQHNGLDFTIQVDMNTVSVQPTAFKILKGRTLSEAQFEFGLYSDEDGVNLIEQVVKNEKDGSVYFSTLRFSQNTLTAATTETYYIKEINNNGSGITYDTHTYKMTISFTDGGGLVWTPVIKYERLKLDDMEEAEWNGTIPEFVNTYTQDKDDTNTPTKDNGTGNGENSNKKTVDVDVRIVWEDDGKNRPDEVVVELVDENGVVQDRRTLSKDNNWSYTWKGLPNQKWTVREQNRPGGFTYREDHGDYHFVFIHNEKLLQTGQLGWPIPFLAGFGFVFIGFGLLSKGFGRKKLNGR